MILDYLVDLGVVLGIVLLNVGIMMWLVGKLSINRNASRLAGEIIKASIMLVAVAVLVHMW